ncbi:hypothetical protein, conserved [Pediculus humanus corporis]|uniref:Host cell factor Kelch-repeats domain-containing protein n=1 Tax=Pediculus humanus subsp. corporis TaxID=121224 RepID=E0VTG2_PEDHC|nr:uncharacterized protein Phum_PHUM432190 [Pediculus humanus corporis]EEB16668.1 hypothetical protein, conserved [Pediculus humanus corporis]
MTNIEPANEDNNILLQWKRINNQAGPMPRPRHGHRAVAIKDLIVIFGGGNEGIVNELSVYNTLKNQWFVPALSGDIPPGCAAYGFVVDGTRMLMFGGMVEYGKYWNDLYELHASRWEWRRLNPVPPEDDFPPCPRLGHSFTLIDNKVYLFGGLTREDLYQNSKEENPTPMYLNDLYTLKLCPDGSVMWDKPKTYGEPPSPRESHSAVGYTDKEGKSRLIIYGGMCGRRLGDVWSLDIETMTWSQPVLFGSVPLPRSLHTASLIGHKMFIFGGWVPLVDENRDENQEWEHEKEWKCTNSLGVLNLETLRWEDYQIGENRPRPRAGHCATVVRNRLYIWSGRDGYRKAWNNQVCCKDLWFLEAEKPAAPGRVQLVRAMTNSLEVNWTPSPNADSYILQIQKYDMPPAPAPVATPVSTPAPVSSSGPVPAKQIRLSGSSPPYKPMQTQIKLPATGLQSPPRTPVLQTSQAQGTTKAGTLSGIQTLAAAAAATQKINTPGQTPIRVVQAGTTLTGQAIKVGGIQQEGSVKIAGVSQAGVVRPAGTVLKTISQSGQKQQIIWQKSGTGGQPILVQKQGGTVTTQSGQQIIVQKGGTIPAGAQQVLVQKPGSGGGQQVILQKGSTVQTAGGKQFILQKQGGQTVGGQPQIILQKPSGTGQTQYVTLVKTSQGTTVAQMPKTVSIHGKTGGTTPVSGTAQGLPKFVKLVQPGQGGGTQIIKTLPSNVVMQGAGGKQTVFIAKPGGGQQQIIVSSAGSGIRTVQGITTSAGTQQIIGTSSSGVNIISPGQTVTTADGKKMYIVSKTQSGTGRPIQIGVPGQQGKTVTLAQKRTVGGQIIGQHPSITIGGKQVNVAGGQKMIVQTLGQKQGSSGIVQVGEGGVQRIMVMPRTTATTAEGVATTDSALAALAAEAGLTEDDQGELIAGDLDGADAEM